jgi:HD-GYP domain-containing protein (c-di-GMP phosphodiesterase class II)
MITVLIAPGPASSGIDNASSHHERNDGSGYPFGMKEKELSFESKILAALDMYQALVETRPYRKALPHDEAIELLYDQVPKNLFEEEIVDLIADIFEEEVLV